MPCIYSRNTYRRWKKEFRPKKREKHYKNSGGRDFSYCEGKNVFSIDLLQKKNANTDGDDFDDSCSQTTATTVSSRISTSSSLQSMSIPRCESSLQRISLQLLVPLFDNKRESIFAQEKRENTTPSWMKDNGWGYFVDCNEEPLNNSNGSYNMKRRPTPFNWMLTSGPSSLSKTTTVNVCGTLATVTNTLHHGINIGQEFEFRDANFSFYPTDGSNAISKKRFFFDVSSSHEEDENENQQEEVIAEL